MASTKLKKRDLNRYRKIYPYLRRQPRYAYVADKETIIEIGSLKFSNENFKVHWFDQKMSTVPVVTAVAFDSEGNNSSDVNVFITAITTKYVRIETSQNFTGAVEFHAIMVAS
tara:strand:- start:193 stop:531 length:339 start_codon:yes stop_codon:yes gene_type:complete